MADSTKSCASGIALVGFAVLLVISLLATPAVASPYKACRHTLLYPPKNGGYGLILTRLHVRRLSCGKAVQIGGGFLVGDGIPRGLGLSPKIPLDEMPL